MSEPSGEASIRPRSAGAILREARQAQGLHIAALAASIKVAQRKLEALEADRFDELPDATFTRALAQTVCRALKIDPVPVLALLPALAGHRLEQVGEGINAPFRDRPGRREPNDLSMLASPAVWGPVLLLLAAAIVYLLPQGWLASLQPGAPAASEPAASAPSSVSVSVPTSIAPEPEPAPPPVTMPPAAQDTPAPAAPASAATSTVGAAPPAAAGPLQLRAKAPSWIEVQDARAKVLLARTVQPGEVLLLDGPTPLRLKIGNARGTEVTFRGQPVDLSPSLRDNVARLELK